ncbi:MAG: leucine-rich repeat domain-containing protein [Clostridia bacterium]|nr:leucine-rich repeat domain-containing protein [Clostridia bacterium]
MKKLLKILLISVLVVSFIFVLASCVTPTDEDTNQNNTDNTGDTDGDNNSNDDGGSTPITPTPDSPIKDGISSTENIFVFEQNSAKNGFILKNVTVKNSVVTIPANYGEKPVTEIAPLVFYSNDTIEEVNIPQTIVTIGERAFSACINLKKVNFEENSTLTTIGNRAFFNCERLTTCTIPLGVKEIGSEAFMNCMEYTSTALQANLSDYSLLKLGHQAFHNTKWFNEKTICGDIRLGKCAYTYTYENYNEGDSISIEYTGADIIAIGEKALYGMENIASVTIGANVSYIGEKALCNMPNLTSITVESGNENYISDGNCLIEKATGKLLTATKNTVIPSYVTTIGEEAYAFRKDITSLTIPNTVTTILNNAFEGSSIVSITLSDELKAIPERAFLDCDKLQSICIKAKVEEIGSAAFNGCTSLKEVTVDSDAILELLIGKLNSPAGLMAYAETVYVLESLENTSPYLSAHFNKVTSDKVGYLKYQIVK